jgi:segregation and condensation protein B
MDDTEIKYFVEAALLAAGRPLSVDQLHALFDGRMAPEKSEIRRALHELNQEFERRGIAIVEVASGFRVQIKPGMVERLQKLWEERPPRYSRALFETLALIAYRQPITRGEIEEIRGVAVSSNIVRSMLERDWIRVLGYRDVPGRPAMFGTTRTFLDYFGLKKLDDLPPLADLSDWESLRVQLNLPEVNPDDDSSEMGEVAEFPVLYPEVAAGSEFEADLPDIEMVLSDDGDESDRAFTRIPAKPWPAPKDSAIDDVDEFDHDIEAEQGADASVSRSQ